MAYIPCNMKATIVIIWCYINKTEYEHPPYISIYATENKEMHNRSLYNS